MYFKHENNGFACSELISTGSEPVQSGLSSDNRAKILKARIKFQTGFEPVLGAR